MVVLCDVHRADGHRYRGVVAVVSRSEIVDENLPKIGLTQFQTKGLSLEEINGLFGDEVAVHFSDKEVSSQEQGSKGTAATEMKEDISHLESSLSTPSSQ